MFHEKLNLEKIKHAIDALSDEEFHELEVWMASQVDDEEEDIEEDEDEFDLKEAFDPGFPCSGPHQGPGGGLY